MVFYPHLCAEARAARLASPGRDIVDTFATPGDSCVRDTCRELVGGGLVWVYLRTPEAVLARRHLLRFEHSAMEKDLSCEELWTDMRISTSNCGGQSRLFADLPLDLLRERLRGSGREQTALGYEPIEPDEPLGFNLVGVGGVGKRLCSLLELAAPGDAALNSSRGATGMRIQAAAAHRQRGVGSSTAVIAGGAGKTPGGKMPPRPPGGGAASERAASSKSKPLGLGGILSQGCES